MSSSVTGRPSVCESSVIQTRTLIWYRDGYRGFSIAQPHERFVGPEDEGADVADRSCSSNSMRPTLEDGGVLTSSARNHLNGECRPNQRIVLLDAAVGVAKTAIVCLLGQSNAQLRPRACEGGGV